MNKNTNTEREEVKPSHYPGINLSAIIMNIINVIHFNIIFTKLQISIHYLLIDLFHILESLCVVIRS